MLSLLLIDSKFVSIYRFAIGFTTFVEVRGPGRIAPEASAGFELGHDEPHAFPPEEAGGVFPAPSSKKSAPHDSKRSAQAPGPWIPLVLTLYLFSKG